MDPRQFGFIDPPPEDGMEAAMINLKQVHGKWLYHEFMNACSSWGGCSLSGWLICSRKAAWRRP